MSRLIQLVSDTNGNGDWTDYRGPLMVNPFVGDGSTYAQNGHHAIWQFTVPDAWAAASQRCVLIGQGNCRMDNGDRRPWNVRVSGNGVSPTNAGVTGCTVQGSSTGSPPPVRDNITNCFPVQFVIDVTFTQASLVQVLIRIDSGGTWTFYRNTNNQSPLLVIPVDARYA